MPLLTRIICRIQTRPATTLIFNPRSVSFDVRTPQELAAVNEFLITLGRDVAQGGGGGGNQRRPHHLMSQRGSDEFLIFRCREPQSNGPRRDAWYAGVGRII